ncbi:monooxygenase [Larkinella soli]|uniref:monooxygenase n=1 Tax=Larkinella soli TaxID=1770527 RepID=UPI001E49A674|nr:hypothetical protein [Larkinella soli]
MNKQMYRSARLGMAVALGLSVLSYSCKTSSEEPKEEPQPVEKATFDLLQDRILTTSCALSGCHSSENDPTFNQHKLVLAAGKAHKNLVGVSPTNTAAKNNGLQRVKAFNALESLLYHKLNTAASHHSGADYGNPMPLGKDLLTVGQIEFVRRWIEAGAPEKGSVVDATLLDDKTPSSRPDQFEALAAPAAGAGFQMTIPAFDVVPNFERELFIRKAVGNKTDVYVKRFQVKMREKSHHFVAYGFVNNNNLPEMEKVRDLRNPDGTDNIATYLQMQNHIFMAASQTSTNDYSFPEGTAMKFPANTTLDLNSHYVNKTDKPIKGEVYFNLFTIDPAQVKYEVKPLYLINDKLTLPPKTRTVVTKTFAMKKRVKVLILTSHTHKLGEKFVIRIAGGARDGEVVYTGTDWEHPEILTLKTPLLLNPGEGLTSEVTYNNTTDKTVTFGLKSDDEMDIIFGYFYEEN